MKEGTAMNRVVRAIVRWGLVGVCAVASALGCSSKGKAPDTAPIRLVTEAESPNELAIVYERPPRVLRIDVKAAPSGAGVAVFSTADGGPVIEAIADGVHDAVRVDGVTVRTGDPLSDGRRAQVLRDLRRYPIVTASMAVFDLACSRRALPPNAGIMRALLVPQAVLKWLEPEQFALERLARHATCSDALDRLGPWLAHQPSRPQLDLLADTATALRGTYRAAGETVAFESSLKASGEVVATFTAHGGVVAEAVVGGRTRDVRIAGRSFLPEGALDEAGHAAVDALGSTAVKRIVGLVPLDLDCVVTHDAAHARLVAALTLPGMLLAKHDPAYARERLAAGAVCSNAVEDTGGCDSPASPITTTNNGSCCDDHDICYHVNGCTAASWLWTVLEIATACANCNNIVAGCILGNFGTGPSVCVNNGTCGWQWCGGTAGDLNAGHYCPPGDAACNCQGPCADDGTACAGSNCGVTWSNNCSGRLIGCGTCGGGSTCNGVVSGLRTVMQCVPNPTGCVDDGTACAGRECGQFPSNNCTQGQMYGTTIPAFVSCGSCDPQFTCTSDGQCGKPSVQVCIDDGQACAAASASNASFCGWVQSHNCSSQTYCGCTDPNAQCIEGACQGPACEDDGTACQGKQCGDAQSTNCAGVTVDCGSCSSGTCVVGQCQCTDDGTACSGVECGTMPSRNCPGQSMACGTCSSGTCVGGQCQCVDDGTACNGRCGAQINNCGQTVDCGPCPCVDDGTACDGRCGPQVNNCGQPVECAPCCVDDGTACNGTCGWQTNNCGASVYCGTCPCVDDGSACAGTCGWQTNNCGQSVYCGDCPCVSDGTACDFGCGWQVDNCGNSVYCGDCGGGGGGGGGGGCDDDIECELDFATE
jgi:hypothetical protein